MQANFPTTEAPALFAAAAPEAEAPRTRSTDADGHPLHVGDWVRYRGSCTPAYGQLHQVTAINSDRTMTLEGAAWTLRKARGTSVAYAPNRGL